jgi:hypothetical protein
MISEFGSTIETIPKHVSIWGDIVTDTLPKKLVYLGLKG